MSTTDIDTLVQRATVPTALQFSGSDPLYGGNPLRLTLFDSGHQRITEAGLTWLSRLPARGNTVTN